MSAVNSVWFSGSGYVIMGRVFDSCWIMNHYPCTDQTIVDTTPSACKNGNLIQYIYDHSSFTILVFLKLLNPEFMIKVICIDEGK